MDCVLPVHERIAWEPVPHAGLPGLRACRVGNRVGESPTWDAARACLWWVDVRARQVLRLDVDREALSRWTFGETVGCVAILPHNRIAVALQHSIVQVALDTGQTTACVALQDEPPGNRLNDGKVSPSGRWWVVGSMHDNASPRLPTGALYCIGAQTGARVLVRGLHVANGIAWSPDARCLYYSDSHLGVVWRAAWDEVRGQMGEPAVFRILDERQGRPDGAAVDREGHYWSAGVSAGCLNQLDPQGQLVGRLDLPCRAPTMACFGGPDLAELFVTSLVRPEWGTATGPWDGALLRFHSRTRGRAAARWAAA